jgi:hypothetical protein
MGIDGRLVDGSPGASSSSSSHRPRPPGKSRPASSRPAGGSSAAAAAASTTSSGMSSPGRRGAGGGSGSARKRPSTAGSLRAGSSNAGSVSGGGGGDEDDYQDPRLRSSLRIALEAERDRKVRKGRAKAVAEEQRRIEWECLKKLEFANEWSAAMGDDKTYRAFKGTEKHAVMMVHVYQNSLKIRELTLDMFEKRYMRIKAKFDDRESRARDITLAPKLSADEYRTQSKQVIRKVLLDTVQLISRLQGQVRSLRAKGGSFSPYPATKGKGK